MEMTAKGLPVVTYQIHSRCIIVRELSQGIPEKNIHSIFDMIMNDIVIPVMKKFELELFSYGIEGNNFYLIITTFMDEKRISRIIQYIKSRFAERYNRLMDRTGPFWMGRSAYEIID